jgi:hypothetical protein
MQRAGQHDQREHGPEEEQHSLSEAPLHGDDGPEFSSGPMPAAFSACLFLGLTLLICVLLVIFW